MVQAIVRSEGDWNVMAVATLGDGDRETLFTRRLRAPNKGSQQPESDPIVWCIVIRVSLKEADATTDGTQ